MCASRIFAELLYWKIQFDKELEIYTRKVTIIVHMELAWNREIKKPVHVK